MLTGALVVHLAFIYPFQIYVVSFPSTILSRATFASVTKDCEMVGGSVGLELLALRIFPFLDVLNSVLGIQSMPF